MADNVFGTIGRRRRKSCPAGSFLTQCDRFQQTGESVRKFHVINTSLLALGLALCVAACSGNKPSSAGRVQPAHAAQGQHLRDTMHQLAERTAYSPVGKLPPDPESSKAVDPRVFDDAATLAASLAETAAKIPTSARDKRLSEVDRQAFEAEAMNLRSHALELERAAKDRKVEQMQRAFDGINASCIACHSRFRDFAGQLDFGRAAAPATRDHPDTLAARAR
jgi:cytochrome c556